MNISRSIETVFELVLVCYEAKAIEPKQCAVLVLSLSGNCDGMELETELYKTASQFHGGLNNEAYHYALNVLYAVRGWQ
tara:strand:+ start:51 stop:287 length:237 start_codon:yes stop_codon:yes gene_type:complete